MFNFFKKKEKQELHEMTAAADGRVIPMSEASDAVFSSYLPHRKYGRGSGGRKSNRYNG